MDRNGSQLENMSFFQNSTHDELKPRHDREICGADPIMFSILSVTIGSIGLLGNLGFMFVVMRVKSMQTATNHYLINLAMADLLYVLVLWIFHLCLMISEDGACIFDTSQGLRCVVGTVVDTAILTSNFSVAFIGIERYVAITQPFRARQICTKGKTIYFNILMWILSIIITLPSAVACLANNPPESIYIAIYFLLIVSCCVSLCTVTILYSLTIYHFKKTAKAMREINDTRHRTPNHDKAVVRLCVLTTVVYFVCLFPTELSLILRLSVQYKGPAVSEAAAGCIHNISIILVLLHSAANPIIYNVMSSKYREAFVTALASCFSRNRNGHLANRSYYYSRTLNTSTVRTVGHDKNLINRNTQKCYVCPKEVDDYSRTTSM
ncbi:somatostatin receptor type 4-like [Ptychodera flava]|uniref:somatostatin receptor type 4-like n=1 Tax=Ptychodera flava TaxID=63121 RepID=UPI00396A26D8